MEDMDAMFQQALDLGEQELDSLRARDPQQAQATARQRKALVQRLHALKGQPGLRHRLEQLQEQQRRLTREARELQEGLKQEILRVRGQSKRYGGYRNAASTTPRSSRFLNKRG